MVANTPGMRGFDPAAPLNTDQDVLHRVNYLVDQDSRRRRSLWLMFLSAEHVQLPVIVPVDDVPEYPDPGFAGNLCAVIANVLSGAAPGGSAVMTLARPGDEAVAGTDRDWSRALIGAAATHGITIRMLCLATESGVQQMVPDDASG